METTLVYWGYIRVILGLHTIIINIMVPCSLYNYGLTSNGPQNDTGNYLGPCSKPLALGFRV